MSTLKVGIVGVGNCASSLIQGIEYYRGRSATFCDLFDKTVYGWIGFGGHAIKHVLAAIACATILAMLQDAARRQSGERRP